MRLLIPYKPTESDLKSSVKQESHEKTKFLRKFDHRDTKTRILHLKSCVTSETPETSFTLKDVINIPHRKC